ncbi:hypothetical protein [Synechococcus sp. MIT S9220]|uniref:hypothetical protein n=1 Tax=Synechococcus sp. MIT S9220 TaxID=166309 RepID=UPI00164B5764|nr:hypothetical protein [Synechococcus sp. MIT S9220]
MKRFAPLLIAIAFIVTACSSQSYGSMREAVITSNDYMTMAGKYTETYSERVRKSYISPPAEMECNGPFTTQECNEWNWEHNYENVSKTREQNIVNCVHEERQIVCFDSRDNSNYRYFRF